MQTQTQAQQRPAQWKAAVWAGGIAGIIFLIIPHGIPWVQSGLISPNVMGRELSETNTIYSATGLALSAGHVVLSVIYALLMAPLLTRLSSMAAVVAGAVIGLGLYVLNYLFFEVLLQFGRDQGELTPVVIHAAFGMVAAGAYKGFARTRRARA